MSSWEYRVIEFVDPSDGPWRAVHEVYRDANGRLTGYAENPAVIMWDSDDAGHLGMDTGREVIKRMMRAFELPALVETDFRRETMEVGRG